VKDARGTSIKLHSPLFDDTPCDTLPRRHAGFYVNRSLAPWAAEALLLVEGGVAPDALDKAVKAFGYPVGPGERSGVSPAALHAFPTPP